MFYNPDIEKLVTILRRRYAGLSDDEITLLAKRYYELSKFGIKHWARNHAKAIKLVEGDALDAESRDPPD